jgi:hypothetical protein
VCQPIFFVIPARFAAGFSTFCKDVFDQIGNFRKTGSLAKAVKVGRAPGREVNCFCLRADHGF